MTGRKREPWSSHGRVPQWDESGGPVFDVSKVVRTHLYAGHGLSWTLAAKHIEDVWGSCYVVTRRFGLDPEPLEFGAALAWHANSCQRCQTNEALALWKVALKHTKTLDIVRALRHERRELGKQKRKRKGKK